MFQIKCRFNEAYGQYMYTANSIRYTEGGVCFFVDTVDKFVWDLYD